ncbi:hypothetical protein FRC02_001351 [Tulasnella sp. 418]|nr:hypothetical protein FRC02_001351 [Tulasnella sp. 418]
MQHMERISTLFNTPTFLLRPVLFFLKRSSSFRRDDELIRDVVRSRIEQAKKRAINVNETGGSEIADCILDLIVEKDMKETGLSYKEDELLGEMMDYLFAGSDTTASALSFGVKFLSKHPSVQIKLHEELVSNFGTNRLISYDEVGSAEKTPYLEAVANEILRLAQVGAGMTRELLEDMVILGKHVPKGTEVLFLTGFAGRLATKSWGAAKARGSPSFKPSKGLWDDEDVEEFKPERWLIDGPDGQKVFSSKQGYSVPFGLGPKSCFGQKLAMLELKMILATISLAFFLNEVPAELNTSELVQKLTRKPAECYVSLVDWEDVKHGR